MAAQTIRSGLWAMLLSASLLTVSGFPNPQNRTPHPLEGDYAVSLTRANVGGGIRFVVSLKRDGSKWVGEVRETPVPVVVKEVTVTGRNNLMVNATGVAGGVPATITLKIDGRKVNCSVNVGPRTADITATKKGGKATTIEGTYEGEGVVDSGERVPFVLIVKRIQGVDG